jgi:ComF family protein
MAAGVHVAGAYAPPLSTSILRMKFGQRTDLADRLCALLPVASLTFPGRPLVVPVPLHFVRLAERGFNPAALLAKGLCERVSGQFEPRLLERTRDTPHQSRLPAGSRRANVQGAFRTRRGWAVELGAAERHAVLVDDVVTTGSTLRACSQALYAAGVVHVTVVALAAAPAPR